MARSFFSALIRARKNAVQSNDEATLLFLDGVDDWLKNSSFSTYRKAPIVLSNYALPADELSALMGITTRSAKEARLDLSKELYQLLGRDFFDLLESGSPEAMRELERRLSLVGSAVTPETLLRPDVLRAIKDELPLVDIDDSLVKLEDCHNEINFLIKNSKGYLESELQGLSPTKLGFLLALLVGKTGGYQDRIAFISKLKGQ